MSVIFLVLAGLNVLGFAVSTWLGFAGDLRFHALAGLFTVVMTLVTQCVAMFHLIGSSKAIKEAAALLKTSDFDFARATRRHQAKVHPIATFAQLFMVVAGILGGAANFGAVSGTTHLVATAVAVLVNLLAIPIEWRVLKENADLIRDLDERLGRQLAAAATEAPATPFGG